MVVSNIKPMSLILEMPSLGPFPSSLLQFQILYLIKNLRVLDLYRSSDVQLEDNVTCVVSDMARLRRTLVYCSSPQFCFVSVHYYPFLLCLFRFYFQLGPTFPPL